MLGPPICSSCLLLADYHPNKENPRKHGDWLCPKCGYECNSFLLEYVLDAQENIEICSKIYKENLRHPLS